MLVLRGGSLLLEFALASLFGSFGFLCFRYLASFFECFLRVYLIVFSYAPAQQTVYNVPNSDVLKRAKN